MHKSAGLLFMFLALTACGKKGPLVYPDMLVPAAPDDVSARQVGTSMRLSFNLPSRDRSGRPIKDVAGVKILKSDMPAGQGPGCTSCTSDFSLFRKLYVDVPNDAQRFGNRVVLLDSSVSNGRSYTYTVTAFTQDDIDGAASARITSAMVSPPLPPALRAISQPTEIILEFARPALEGVFVGYSLYRTVKGEPFSYLPYVGTPLAANQYTDMGMDRGVTYVYAARTVVRQSSGVLVESSLSAEVEARLKDDE